MKELKKIGNIITDIFIVILTFCFFVALYHYTCIKILNQPYTDFAGYTYFNIKTGSMADTINIDDYVFVKITDDVKIDDIISYVQGDEVITHRLISINEDGKYITKGDANDTNDDPIDKEQIIGKVVKVGVQYGVVLKIITEPAVLISFLTMFIIINIIITSYKKKKYDEIYEEVKIPKIKTPIIPTSEEERTKINEELQKMIQEQKNEETIKKNKKTISKTTEKKSVEKENITQTKEIEDKTDKKNPSKEEIIEETIITTLDNDEEESSN